jgi:hypothetical protein
MTRRDMTKQLHTLAALLGATLLTAGGASRVSAQLPGLPVLQNAFVGPGFAAAVNGGGGSDGSAFAAAAGWAPGSARFQVSLGIGVYRSEGETGGAFGARAAVPVFSMMNGDLGVAAFGGIGGARGPTVQGARVGLGYAPVGAAVGYRRAFGGTRGLSLYAAPFVAFFRNDFGDAGSESSTLFRFSVGADFALTQAIGITAGLEAGSTGGDDRPGPSGITWGAGVSYIFGRR